MEKTYTPHAIEQRWYEIWEKNQYFAPLTDHPSEHKPYCIMIPPPNVTGTLHMGHAFQDTLMDALIRYHRMQGDNTLWQAGTDHAGIATQMVVERQLAEQQQTRTELGREAFIAKVWEWKAVSGGAITQQLRRMGASLDWSRERFTLDEGLSEAVKEAFVRLYEEGLIYRGKRLVNWDPVLHTAVSDLEVIAEEEDGHLWHIHYPLTHDPSQYLTVATTRPETLLGDTAVAVHPEDERYQALIGQTLNLPLTGRTIPIIADGSVDPTFGTGCVKITPAHDFNDYATGQRHHLPLINIFTLDAKINDQAPVQYQGMDRYVARQAIVADLKQQHLLAKVTPHKLMVPRGDRSKTVIEPLLTDQWFVKMESLAQPAIQAVKDGQIRFVPDTWAQTYFAWMNSIQDWCISRQLWWGHRIPAWYDPHGQVFVGRTEAEVRQHHALPPDLILTQDPDVLDTWFSSGLWPFSTLGWPQSTPALQTFYPGNVLVTGFDIIFFWVARMIMMGLKFTGQIPFRVVYMHGLVRDSEGHKMSKSKGNVLDPIDIIDGIALEPLVKKRTSNLMQPEMAPSIEVATRKQFPQGIPDYGTDALRFTFAAMASTGRDIRFDLNRVAGYRNFCNKLWNAARFVIMTTSGHDTGLDNPEVLLGTPEQWIISRLQQTAAQVDIALQSYRFDLATQHLYEFTWNDYCDWYLELCKPVLTDPDSPPAALRSTRQTLVRVLEALLRLAHPLIPFITEEIWQRIAPLAGKTGDTIMLQPYPQANPALIEPTALADIQWLQAVILGIRQIRGEMDISPAKRLTVLLQQGDATDQTRVQRYQASLLALAKLDSLQWLQPQDQAPESATALVNGLKILIPMAGLIDKQAELSRLRKALEKAEKDHQQSQRKLDNPDFVARASAAVVTKEQARLAENQDLCARLAQQIAQIDRL